MAVAERDDETAKSSQVVGPTKSRLLSILGPGLITGASDDDPSGIATYSQVGTQAFRGRCYSAIH
jgi:Mn2+/Fe2+ NRAMP family transporter